MGMFSELKKIDEKAQDQRQEKKPRRASPARRTPTTPPPPPVNQTINRPVNQPIDRSMNRTVNQAMNQPIESSNVLGKPKGFYITRQQDEELDEAVKKVGNKLAGKAMIKIDRSIVLRLILDEANLSSEDTIERLSNQLINRLINQLINK
jgi:hypothetical protein